MTLGWDNNTSQMNSDILEKVTLVFEQNKPIILLTHVPIDSLVDKSLGELSMSGWDRNLTWAEDANYVPMR